MQRTLSRRWAGITTRPYKQDANPEKKLNLSIKIITMLMSFIYSKTEPIWNKNGTEFVIS